MTDTQDELKRQAAEFAVQFIRSGMRIGLGSGSTSMFALRRIGELLKQGALHDVAGLPTSEEVAREAERLAIPLLSYDDPPPLDLTIDGADEVDPDFNLIKGGGGALLREKIVAQASRREIIIVDESKLTPRLGTRFCLPIEVLPFAWGAQAKFVESLGARPNLRKTKTGDVFSTDQGNYILDCEFGPIADPVDLAAKLAARAGIVEHGLFLGLATDLIVAGSQGVRHLTRSNGGSR